jgi:hypothetical protein
MVLRKKSHILQAYKKSALATMILAATACGSKDNDKEEPAAAVQPTGSIGPSESGVFSASTTPVQALTALTSTVDSLGSTAGSLMIATGATSLRLTAEDNTACKEQDARPLKTQADEAANGEMPGSTDPANSPKEETIGNELSPLSPTFAQKQAYCSLTSQASPLVKSPFMLKMVLCLLQDALTEDNKDKGKIVDFEADVVAGRCEVMPDMADVIKITADVTYSTGDASSGWSHGIKIERLRMATAEGAQEQTMIFDLAYRVSASELALKYSETDSAHDGGSATAFTLSRGSEGQKDSITVESKSHYYEVDEEDVGQSGGNDRVRIRVTGTLNPETGALTDLADYEGIVMFVGRSPDNREHGSGQVSTVKGSATDGLLARGYHTKIEEEERGFPGEFSRWTTPSVSGVCLADSCGNNTGLEFKAEDTDFLMLEGQTFETPAAWANSRTKPLVISEVNFNDAPSSAE